MVLKTEGKERDTSRTCKYCIDVKGWKGIGHTESECFTTKREAGKEVKEVEEEDDDDEGNVLCVNIAKVVM